MPLWLVNHNEVKFKAKIIKTMRTTSQNKKLTCVKWTHGLCDNYYRVATLPKSYLIHVIVIMQSWKSIGYWEEKGKGVVGKFSFRIVC